MAAALQQAVIAIQQTNYATVVTLTAIGYDYFLTFPDEIEYIWASTPDFRSLACSNSTIEQTLDMGLYIVFFRSLPRAVFCYNYYPCRNFFSAWTNESIFGLLLYQWTTLFFMFAADLVTILRVWALYNRSKFILIILLPSFVTEIVVFLAVSIVYSAQHNPQGAVVHVLDFSFCAPNLLSVVFLEVVDIVQLTLGTLMCLLISIRVIRESVQVRRATKRFQISRYTNLFAREGILCFLALLAYALNNSFSVNNTMVNTWLTVPQYVPAYTLVPRFILSLRALYARDLQVERRSDIDTAFGFTSADHGTIASGIVFADARQNEMTERAEEIMVVEREAHGAA